MTVVRISEPKERKMAIVEFQDVTKVYTAGDHKLKALDGANLSLDEGKFVVILGPSGAGKSTLLNLLGGLDSPTSGRISVCGKDISKLSERSWPNIVRKRWDLSFSSTILSPRLPCMKTLLL